MQQSGGDENDHTSGENFDEKDQSSEPKRQKMNLAGKVSQRMKELCINPFKRGSTSSSTSSDQNMSAEEVIQKNGIPGEAGPSNKRVSRRQLQVSRRHHAKVSKSGPSRDIVGKDEKNPDPNDLFTVD